MIELHRQVLDLEEKVTLTESKSTLLDSELADLKFDLDVALSEWDTQKIAHEWQIKSLELLITELKDKASDVEDRMDI